MVPVPRVTYRLKFHSSLMMFLVNNIKTLKYFYLSLTQFKTLKYIVLELNPLRNEEKNNTPTIIPYDSCHGSIRIYGAVWVTDR